VSIVNELETIHNRSWKTLYFQSCMLLMKNVTINKIYSKSTIKVLKNICGGSIVHLKPKEFFNSLYSLRGLWSFGTGHWITITYTLLADEIYIVNMKKRHVRIQVILVIFSSPARVLPKIWFCPLIPCDFGLWRIMKKIKHNEHKTQIVCSINCH